MDTDNRCNSVWYLICINMAHFILHIKLYQQPIKTDLQYANITEVKKKLV